MMTLGEKLAWIFIALVVIVGLISAIAVIADRAQGRSIAVAGAEEWRPSPRRPTITSKRDK